MTTLTEAVQALPEAMLPWQVVAEGRDLSALETFEDRFQEGDKGILEVQLPFRPPGIETTLRSMDAGLRAVGVRLWRSSRALGRSLRVYFQKGLAPLAIIAAAIAAAVLIIGGTISWRLFRLSPTQFSLASALIVAALAAGLALVFVVMRSMAGG